MLAQMKIQKLLTAVAAKKIREGRGGNQFDCCVELITGQRAQWDLFTSTSGGMARPHSGMRKGQRGSKAHPEGMACRGGTVPSMVSSGRVRSVARFGTACKRPRVYGYAG